MGGIIVYKVYCGKNAAIMENDVLSFIFLRIKDDNIISILKHSHFGIVGIVSGYGNKSDAYADYCFVDPDTGLKHSNVFELNEALENHKKDTVCTNDSNKLIYTTFDGIVYHLQIADELSEDVHLIDSELSLADKMRIWNCGMSYATSYLDNYYVEAEMNTEKYSATYNINPSDNFIYCRFGMHGYCNKGYAMLSTICIRHNECRMIPDNTEALKGFTPDEKYFVDNSCAFPPDGSWYWSVENIDDNTVYLNGCGGGIYEIHRN